MSRTILFLLAGIALSIALSFIFPGFILLLPLVFAPLVFRRKR